MSPAIKRGVKSEEAKTGFEAYDGPAPSKRGMYRAVLKKVSLKEYKSGAQGYFIVAELEAAKGDPKSHKQFDGFPMMTNLVFGDHDAMVARESNFYASIGAKNEPSVVFEEGELTTGCPIKTIGGINPVGRVVNLDIKMGTYEGDTRPEVDGIYKLRDDAAPAAKGRKAPAATDEGTDDEDDLIEVEEVEGDEDDEEAYTEAELKAMPLADLREVADQFEVDHKGLKKADLVAAILAIGEEDEDEDEEDEADDEAEEEEEEEDDEVEADEPDNSDLDDLDRLGLKRVLKELVPDFIVKKSMADTDLRDAIVDARADAPPF